MLRSIGSTLRHNTSHETPLAHTEDAIDSCLVQAAGLALRGEHEDDICNYIIGCCEQMRLVLPDGAVAKTLRVLLTHVAEARRRVA
jgi:hypothetical protein